MAEIVAAVIVVPLVAFIAILRIAEQFPRVGRKVERWLPGGRDQGE